MQANAKPFVKWAGGKRQLIKELFNLKPLKFNNYFEPFVGGGALYFQLLPEKAFLSDINPELINLYKVIRNNLKLLLDDLKLHQNNIDYYYKVRDLDRTDDFNKLSNVQRASRFIFLNRTCYNGLYRVNSKGQFNAPFGYYKNPKIFDLENLVACSKVLKNADIKLSSFLDIEKDVKKKDFVYFDPPYVPITKTSSFTKYHKDDFGMNMQIELKEMFKRLTTKGVYCMLSNSYTENVLELYKDFEETTFAVSATRLINCKAERRGKIKELIITNYPVENAIQEKYHKRLSA
jgi:DNA adenine methylase